MGPSEALLATPDVDRFCVFPAYSGMVGTLQDALYKRVDVANISFHHPIPYQSFHSGSHTFPG